MSGGQQDLQPDQDYQRAVERHQDFKDRVHALLQANYAGVVRDTPNGRHNLEFAFEENFFGFTRKWRVVTASGNTPLPYERAIRIVSAHKEDIEQHSIDGVLIVSESGAERFALNFLAENQGFLHRTLDDLQAQKVISEATIAINHQDPAYAISVGKIEETGAHLVGHNGDQLPPSIMKRLIAEVEAILRLLKETEIRAELVVSLVVSALKFIVKTFGTNAAGMAAGAALVSLGHLLGFH